MKTIIDRLIELALSWDELKYCDPIGQDSDSSSLVLTALQAAGVLVAQNGATYTGNMYSSLKKCGFEDITADVDLETGDGLKAGDILLTPKKSTAIYTGNGEFVFDMTGAQPYSNLSWKYTLRFPHIVEAPEEEKTEKEPAAASDQGRNGDTLGTFWGKVVCSTVTLNVRRKPSPNASVVHYAPRDTRHLFEDKNYDGWYKFADGSGYCSAKHIKRI